jgi:hypothetical protein
MLNYDTVKDKPPEFLAATRLMLPVFACLLPAFQQLNSIMFIIYHFHTSPAEEISAPEPQGVPGLFGGSRRNRLRLAAEDNTVKGMCNWDSLCCVSAVVPTR